MGPERGAPTITLSDESAIRLNGHSLGTLAWRRDLGRAIGAGDPQGVDQSWRFTESVISATAFLFLRLMSFQTLQ